MEELVPLLFLLLQGLDHTLTKAAASTAYLSVKPRQQHIFLHVLLLCRDSRQRSSSISKRKKKQRHLSHCNLHTTKNKTFFRAFANTRQSSLDGLTGRGGAYSSASKPRPSSSETNLRKLAAGADGMARPGSALGLLQGNTQDDRKAKISVSEIPGFLFRIILPPKPTDLTNFLTFFVFHIDHLS